MFKKIIIGTKQVKQMNILRKIKNFFKRIFCGKEKTKPTQPVETEKYELVYEDNFDKPISDFWTIVKTRYSSWCKYAGSSPKLITEEGESFYRFPVTYNDDTYHTAAIKSKGSYGDGKIEVVARFKSGKATWPAIWMTHPNGAQNNYETYYEIDVSEYYETRDTTDTTYHCPQSMRGGDKPVQPTKTAIKKNNWNTFVCTWDEESICVNINGVKSFVFKNDGDPLHYPTVAENRTFQVILSMQYGNKWLSEPDNSELPLWMDIKSFKLWKKL